MERTGTIRWISALLMGLGTVLTAVTLFQVSIKLSAPTPPADSFLLGVALGLPFAVGLICGGYYLTYDPFSRAYDYHFAVGALSGLVFFVVFLGGIAIHFFDSVARQAEIFNWAASLGAGGGFFISYLHIHTIDREVVSKRAEVLVAESKRRQELLEYLNGLLRHEVLNTVTAIEGHAALAEEATDDENVTERLHVIQRQTDELTAVINDVRVWLKASNGTNALQPVNLVSVLREELTSLEDAHWTVETETDLPAELWVPADDLIRRLFSNLLENAVVHNDESTPRVSVTASREDETVTVDIEDNGPGFPKESLDAVIESQTNTDPSHGLGLSIVRRLADRYDGRITLSKTGPAGSRISVTLPQSTGPTPGRNG